MFARFLRQLRRQDSPLPNLHHPIFQVTGKAIFVVRANGQILDYNEQAGDLLGLSPTTTIHDIYKMWSFIKENGDPLPFNEYPCQTTFANGCPQQQYVIGIQRHGHLLWVASNTLPLYQGNTLFAVAVSLKDITAERRYLKDLQDRERRYRSLFEQVNDAVFILDLNGVHVDVNHKACEMLGYNYHELINITFREVVANYEYPNSEGVLQRLLAGEIVPVYERIFRHKDGTEFPVEINVQLVHNDTGKPLYIQSIVRDIRRRKADAQRQMEYQLLQEQQAMLDEFIRDIAHDVRTPLTIISNSSYLLKKSSDHQEKYLKSIDDEVHRLSKLLDELLLMSRLNHGADLTMQPINLNSLLQQVIQSVMPLAAQKNLHIQPHPNPPIPEILGNVEAMANLFHNILKNAIFFSPNAAKPIEVISSVCPSEIVISIRDYGVGIAPEHLPKLFKPLHRSDTSRNSQTGGAGLGLTIAQKIAEAHGGGIRVESTQGEGSTFSVHLPRTPKVKMEK